MWWCLTRGSTKAHIARAVLECIAYQTADLVRVMNADAPCPLTELRVDGGASVSDILMQIQADLLRLPVDRPAQVETTAFGAAALAGNPLTLTETEAQLLRLLAQHRGDVLSAREIYEAVWKESFLPSANNTVMVHIKNLRKKLETDLTQPKYIHTVWGKGYYLA